MLADIGFVVVTYHLATEETRVLGIFYLDKRDIWAKRLGLSTNRNAPEDTKMEAVRRHLSAHDAPSPRTRPKKECPPLDKHIGRRSDTIPSFKARIPCRDLLPSQITPDFHPHPSYSTPHPPPTLSRSGHPP